VALRREKEARAQMAAGVAVEVALLRAQTETAQARTQIANLEGQRAQFLAVLGALLNEPVRPTPMEAGSGVDWGEVREEGAQPWKGNYGVRAATKAVEAAEGVVRYDRFAWLPTVAAVGKGNYNSNAGFTGRNLSFDVLLAVNVPLYDRGLRYAARAEDEAKLAQARANLEASSARARANWVGSRANLEAAKAAQAQAEAQAQLAGRAQKQVEAAARAGMATNLELSDADNRRFLANSSAAQARATVEIRRAELAAAEGHLAELVHAE
jgi:outer membrane protein TolC